MRHKISYFSLLFVIAALAAGCVGINPIPNWLQQKPYTLVRGGDQIWRDQLANRLLVAKKMAPIKGIHQNELLSFLGQPYDIRIIQRGVSEDWYFNYYERYKTWPNTPQGTFLVRIYQNKVLDVVNLK